MTADVGVRRKDPALEALQSLDARALAAMERRELVRRLEPALSALGSAGDRASGAAVADAALRACQLLHTASRSREALMLASSALGFARMADDEILHRRALSTCGILCVDLGDPVAAIDHQVDALRLARDDRVAAGRAWSNIGLAMAAAGHSAMAARCYERALAVMEGTGGPLDARYVTLVNLAQMQFETGDYEDGLVSAHLALGSESTMLQRDPMMVLRLRRNLVRLLVAVGRVEDAEPHVLDAKLLAERIRTPRAAIAASLASGVYDLARGDADVGLTRLDTALAQAREMPGVLRDTLACVVRAEELAGHSERALLRLRELCDVLHASAVAAARQHIELASLADREQAAVAQEHAQARARLISKLGTPRQPDGWSALDRLGVTASVRMEPSGLHGKRVGALAKALALADGTDPLQSLEIGLACELHDIGMISVPEELLSKQPLSAELEHTIIERHVRAGAEILADDQHPRIFLAREVVRYHHAHWDGSGHPEQVAGTRIPYAARICAIADAYEDFVCGTRGRSRRTMDEALQRLRTQAGRMFDPQLVERFETMIRAETDDLGLDITAGPGMDNFQQLVSALQEDRGFV
jgi:response regulator RpfG family c-di-GMP phosphodiesterase